MKFITLIKDTAGISTINEVQQLFESFARMYPDVIEGIETDLLNSPQDAKNEDSFRESIKNVRKCAITYP